MGLRDEIPGRGSMLWRVVGSFVGLALCAAVVYFFYSELSENWTKFLAYDWTIRYHYVGISLAILFVVFAISPIAWVKILKLQGESLGNLQAFVIFYLANLGKYIPGKLWGYGGQVYLTKKQGIEIQHILVSTALLLILDYFAGMALAAITLLAWHNVPALAAIGGTAAVILLMALLSWSKHGLGLLKRGLARIKVTALDDVPAGTALFRIWLFLMLRWVLLGISFVIGIKGLIDVNIVESIAYCSAFTWSHLLSMIVIVVPAGIGVREGLMVYFLEMVSTLPPWIAIGISVATRLWMSIMELLCVLPAIGIKRILK
jgi:hypothetical protein